MAKELQQVHIELPADQLETLREWGIVHERSITWLVKQAVDNYIRANGMTMELKNKTQK